MLFFHMNTPAQLPGQNFFDKLALLSQQGGQNGIILPLMHFHFKSIRISFISKVARVDRAMIVANDTRLCGSIMRSPGLNFPYKKTTKFIPVTEPARAHMKRHSVRILSRGGRGEITNAIHALITFVRFKVGL